MRCAELTREDLEPLNKVGLVGHTFDAEAVIPTTPTPEPTIKRVALEDLPDYVERHHLRAVRLDWPNGGEPVLETVRAIP